MLHVSNSPPLACPRTLKSTHVDPLTQDKAFDLAHPALVPGLRNVAGGRQPLRPKHLFDDLEWTTRSSLTVTHDIEWVFIWYDISSTYWQIWTVPDAPHGSRHAANADARPAALAMTVSPIAHYISFHQFECSFLVGTWLYSQHQHQTCRTNPSIPKW